MHKIVKRIEGFLGEALRPYWGKGLLPLPSNDLATPLGLILRSHAVLKEVLTHFRQDRRGNRVWGYPSLPGVIWRDFTT